MDLKTFIADSDRRAALAKACDTTPAYLYQLSIGWRGRRPSKSLAKLLARESARIGPEGVPIGELRPGVKGDPTAPAARAAVEVEHDPDAGRVVAFESV